MTAENSVLLDDVFTIELRVAAGGITGSVVV
jgi:hypothetical protein